MKAIIGTIILINLSSCKKYLDEKADKKLTQLKTLPDLQALLDDYATLNFETTPGFGETCADDYFLLLDDFNSRTDDSRAAYTWQPYDYPYTNDWSVGYRGIYSANYCLDYIGSIPTTNQNQTAWNNVKGSALFHRAYRFLNLLWIYGKAYDETSSSNDPGIVLRLSSDPTISSKRASVKDSYNQIIQDAMEATNYLPNSPQHVMRPSKAAAFGLLARVYLSMRKYDSAYKYADLCLQINSNVLDYNSPTIDSTSDLPFPEFNTEIIFYTTQSQFYGAKNPLLKSLVDTTLFSSYSSDDLRKSIFFQPKNGYYYFKGTYSTVSGEDLFSGIATDEMLLTRAECHTRAGRITEAITDLNTLINNRWRSGTFIPFTASNQQQALSIVLTERRKELLMRGLRWIDIKRLNKEGANIILKRIEDKVYTLDPNSNKYALPLPKDIIDITGIPQNPGWE